MQKSLLLLGLYLILGANLAAQSADVSFELGLHIGIGIGDIRAVEGNWGSQFSRSPRAVPELSIGLKYTPQRGKWRLQAHLSSSKIAWPPSRFRMWPISSRLFLLRQKHPKALCWGLGLRGSYLWLLADNPYSQYSRDQFASFLWGFSFWVEKAFTIDPNTQLTLSILSDLGLGTIQSTCINSRGCFNYKSRSVVLQIGFRRAL